MSFPIYFFKGKEKNNSVISNCSSSYTAYHQGLRAFPSALPCHLWQQLAALTWLAASRLWNCGRKVVCASGGFSFFVRRDISPLWGAAGDRGRSSEDRSTQDKPLGVCIWLGCCCQGLLDRMFSWCLPVCWLCCPKKSKQKMVTFGVLRTLEEGNKLSVLTSFSPLYLFFIDIRWENMR